MGNRDRFGQNYFPMKQQSLVPGPGSYEAPTDFRSHIMPQLYSRNNLINAGKYSSLSKVNTISIKPSLNNDLMDPYNNPKNNIS